MNKDSEVMIISSEPRPMRRIKLTRFEAGRNINSVESQLIEQDPYTEMYTLYNLVAPPFLTNRLNYIYEESDMLQRCITAYQNNIDGFGYNLLYLGEDRKRGKVRDSSRQLDNLEGFFKEPNEECSFQTIRKNMRRDYEIFGYCFAEFTRFPYSQKIATCNYIPSVDIRVSVLDQEPITIEVPLYRDGSIVKVNIQKRFRRFAQVLHSESHAMRWFKSFGDPRMLNAETGDYVKSKPKKLATELLYIRRRAGMKSYGIPRWSGSIPDVIGRAAAQYINYDLMENQGVAPTMIIVQNGSLTDESKKELRKLVDSMRGVENFNRLALLEAVPELHGIDDKSNVTVDFKSMAEYRREDLMFAAYLTQTADDIRQSFRLPAIYIGQESQESYATGFATQRVCEQQVFIPEREDFDEIVNRRIVRQELGCDLWQYQSKGPRISSSEELRLALKEFGNAGAITVNHAISMANELLGLQMSKYTEKWADLPVAFVRTQLNNGTMTIPEITNNPMLSSIVGQKERPKDPEGRPEVSSDPVKPDTPSERPGQDTNKRERSMVDA